MAASLEAPDEWEDWEVWDDWDDGQAPSEPAADGFFEDGADGSVPAEPFGGEDGAPAPGRGGRGRLGAFRRARAGTSRLHREL